MKKRFFIVPKGETPMVKHVTRAEVEAFCAQDLPGRDTITIAGHLHGCEECRRLFESASRSQKFHRPLIFDFSPGFSPGAEHLDYDALVAYAEGEAAEAEAEKLEAHRRECSRCDQDVRDFQAYLREFDAYRDVRLGPQPLPDRIRAYLEGFAARPNGWLAPAPAMAVLCCLLLGGVLTAAGLFYFRGEDTVTGSLQRVPPEGNGRPVGVDQGAVTTPTVEAHDSSGKGDVRDKTSGRVGSGGGKVLLALNDGGRRYRIDAGGEVAGADGYPKELAEEIRNVLRGRIVRASPPPEVASVTIKNRGAENSSRVVLVGPSDTYVATRRPVFEWRPLAKSARYVVSVVDENFNEVEKSPELTTTIYRSRNNLIPGSVYRWQVRAVAEGEAVTQQEVGKFMVASEATFDRVSEAKSKYRSHLVMGLIYKREGLLYEAEKEFQRLVTANPKSKTAKRLLDSVRTK